MWPSAVSVVAVDSAYLHLQVVVAVVRVLGDDCQRFVGWLDVRTERVAFAN